MISVEFLTKLKLYGETNLTCITVTSHCDQYVTKVINQAPLFQILKKKIKIKWLLNVENFNFNIDINWKTEILTLAFFL